jgi:Predicted GTPase, probable translation factor
LDDVRERHDFSLPSGWRKPAWSTLILAKYELLDLIIYFSAGSNQGPAWTVHNGNQAPEGPRRIPTDFEKGFFCAQTITMHEYVDLRGKPACQDAGKNETGKAGTIWCKTPM